MSRQYDFIGFNINKKHLPQLRNFAREG